MIHKLKEPWSTKSRITPIVPIFFITRLPGTCSLVDDLYILSGEHQHLQMPGEMSTAQVRHTAYDIERIHASSIYYAQM